MGGGTLKSAGVCNTGGSDYQSGLRATPRRAYDERALGRSRHSDVAVVVEERGTEVAGNRFAF